MKLGPVGSQTKDIAELSNLSSEAYNYSKKYIKPSDEKKQSFVSLKPEDLSLFSKTDIECLELVYNKFSDKDQFELADITHTYPEWIKYKKDIDAGKKRVRMSYEDFFTEFPKNDALFNQSKAELELAKDSFE